MIRINLLPESVKSVALTSKACKTSLYVGVSFNRDHGKWEAAVTVSKRRVRLGSFSNEESAARAYDEYVIKNGLNKRLNFAVCPFVLPAGAMAIPLTKGKWAIVDAADYQEMSRYKCFTLGKYAALNVNGKQVYLHRVIMNAPDTLEVDHVNRNKLDNRRSNLRLASVAQNGRNRVKQRGCHSNYLGVTFDKRNGRWISQIVYQYKRSFIGYFDSEREAATARDLKALELDPDFFALNFPELREGRRAS